MNCARFVLNFATKITFCAEPVLMIYSKMTSAVSCLPTLLNFQLRVRNVLNGLFSVCLVFYQGSAVSLSYISHCKLLEPSPSFPYRFLSCRHGSPPPAHVALKVQNGLNRVCIHCVCAPLHLPNLLVVLLLMLE